MDHPNLSRRGFFTASGGISMAAIIAACGGSDKGSSSSAAAGGTTAAGGGGSTAAPAAKKFDPASETGPIRLFEWEGYEAKAMWADYLAGPYKATSPLKFTFLEDDQQALAKVAAGVQYDIIHPCIAFWKDYQAAGLIQPWDTSLLPNLQGIPAVLLKEGQDASGNQYHIPFDIGFSSIVYRADRVQPKELSWNLYQDSRYKGRMGCYSDGVVIIKIGALINGVTKDPNTLNSDEIAAAKETMIGCAKNFRSFWTSNTDNQNDFINGNLDATYVWPDGYWAIKNHPKMKGVPIEYMWPKEGRLAWVCGFVLGSQTKVPGRATVAVAAANTPKSAAWLTDAFQYGAAQQDGVEALIKNKALIKVFSLDDPAAFAPPASPGAHGAWFEKPLANRNEYVKAAQEVKASVSS